jgi:hypothetical protein
MAMAMESGEQSRNIDLRDEPVDLLLAPIRGYEDKPVVSLTETVEPISEFFKDIQDYVYVALHNCQNPDDGLDQQESASIHLYTMQFHGGSSLYLLLNQSLRAEDREQLKPWFSFLKLFLTALYKLPSQSKRVWRCVKNIDLTSKYKTGTKFVWWGVSSCTTHIEVLQSNAFLGNHGERTIFSIDCINGKSIASHSYFKNKEKEIILMPGSYFEVIGQLNPAPQLHIIQLKEINPPMTFIKPPFSSSATNNLSSVIEKSNKFSQATSNIISKEIPLKSSMIYFYFSSQMISSKFYFHLDKKWKQDGIIVAGGNGKGNKLNQLFNPRGIFIDDDQTIYIADYDNHRMFNGNLMKRMVKLLQVEMVEEIERINCIFQQM